jgi:hypothetical protein
MSYYLKKTSASKKVVEEMKSNGIIQPQGIGPRSRNIGLSTSVSRPTPSQPLSFRLSEPTPKTPKIPKEPKSPLPKAPKAPKELMSSVKLQQKAAGYMLAAANARSRE